MPSSPKMLLTVLAADTHLKDHVTVVDEATGSRHDVILAVESYDQELSFAGTFDDLVDFGAAILAAVYAWPILHGHSDWLGELVRPQSDRSMTDDTENGNGRTAASDGASRAQVDGS